mmetsp:Transcript_116270/g.328921  ORF Transcript_116270/g.328921 Transcript_116270/m.328921 type:complete len:121 (-) Transcript_116270:45-407(-)|eukprot:CAMPEP_0117491714 /NCGR_PEP_ID=MMETSP0784-20121206/18210_1 /TAXON_ID=39447 /ORGANISM="" /LENGTH=120 /DNA_ID=CAMNT_0005286515 /DNA_START=107 /DNA_END=469 /DNA_ORIENTATION=+
MGAYGKAKGAGKGKATSKTPYDRADDSCKVYVGNLSFQTRWQQLKDHMGQAGTVNFVKVMEDKGKSKGKGSRPWSKGMAVVEFAFAEEAQCAIDTLNEVELDGRNLMVDAWTTGYSKDKA